MSVIVNKELRNTTGVYMFQSVLKPCRIYIGSGYVWNRKYNHIFALRRNKHQNVKLQRHYNKYGESDLVFDVLESGDYINTNHLLSREQMWIGRFSFSGKNTPYFNILPTAGSNKGIKFSEKHRKKISEKNKGRKVSEEGRKNMSEAQKGTKRTNRKPRSIEANKKQSERMKGKPPWNKGKKGVMPTPWNKGKKGVMPVPWSKGKKLDKAPRTAYKKGNIPWNKGRDGYNKGKGVAPIVQYDKNGFFIREWLYANEIAETLGISVHTIRRICNGYVYKKANLDFVFRYKKDVVL